MQVTHGQNSGLVPVQFPARLRAVVLDVDGTLYDARQLRLQMMGWMLSQFVIHPREGMLAIRLLRVYRNALETLRLQEDACDIAARQLEACCQQTGIDESTARKIIASLFEAAPLKFLAGCIYPGLKDFLLEARRAEVRLGIVSDYPAAAKLQALGLDGLFDAVAHAGDPLIGRLKPHPRALQFCLKQLQVDASEAIYIGDRPDVDMPCALRAGVHPVILGTKRGDTLFSSVSNYADLLLRCRQAWARPQVCFA